MAGLVPYDAKNITANYSSTDKQFTVIATALLPVLFTSAEFKRVDNANKLGGRTFRLEGVRGGGAGVPKQTMMQKAYTEKYMSAKPRFQPIDVVLLDPVEKTETTVSVDLTRDAPAPVVVPVPLQPQPMPALGTKNNPSALKPIDITLPAQKFVRITAPISDSTSTRPTIEGRIEGNAISVWRAGEMPGFVYWDIAGAGDGAGVGKSGVFTVTTTVSKGAQGGGVSGQAGGAGSQVTVQPYAINLSEIKKELVDLFDPDA
ncbi:hypothetical protein Q7P35_007383 [Cladosporium inversicolor]